MSELIELLGGEGSRRLAELSPSEARSQLAEQVRDGNAGADGEEVVIQATARDVPVRIHRPERTQGSLPTLVYLHGGGWVVGELGASAARAQALADEARCVVAVVDYRLAPEDRFPAAIDDVHAAVEWLGAHAGDVGGDPGRLALLGDSSGGNLAAAASLRARDSGSSVISCQVLICPVLDFEFSGPSMDANAEGYLMEREDLRWCWAHYLASDADGLHPYASPARATTLTGLPPTFLITAEFDPLRDQAEDFARRLQRDGVVAGVNCYRGVVHSFTEYDGLDQAAMALQEAVSFLTANW